MPQHSGDTIPGEERDEKTLAELVLWLDDPDARRELEDFRIKFEAEFGPTDLTKRYTSTWPKPEQNWLIKHHPKRYWDGLPPFAQGFLRQKMVTARRLGKLDDVSDDSMKLYLAAMGLSHAHGDDGPQR
jgi:hypothetical protein